MARNRRAYKYSQTTPGAEAPPVWQTMSATKRDKIKKSTEQQIDEFMKRVGYANPAERTDENGGRWFTYGSAQGRAGLVEADADGEVFLRVESRVMDLPSDENELLSLIRELMQANLTIAGSARVGMSGQGIFVCATVPIVELVPGDVPSIIHSVMTIADRIVSPFGQVEKQEGVSQEQTPPEKAAES